MVSNPYDRPKRKRKTTAAKESNFQTWIPRRRAPIPRASVKNIMIRYRGLYINKYAGLRSGRLRWKFTVIHNGKPLYKSDNLETSKAWIRNNLPHDARKQARARRIGRIATGYAMRKVLRRR